MTHSFEDSIAQAISDLKPLFDEREALVATIVEAAASADSPGGDAMAALEGRGETLLARQRTVHGDLADAVAQIATVVDAERALFDSKETPLRADVLVGYFSKTLMRRRMERRSARSGSTDRLRLALGRADRLAGLIDGERQAALGQRSAAEDAFAEWRAGLAGVPPADEAGGANDEELRPMPPGIPGGATAVFAALVDVIGSAVRDHTIMLQKLNFDIEHLLDLYSVLSQTMPGPRAQELSPEAYPHFSSSVRRLVDGILPGTRLADIRQAADLAFFERFAKA